MMQHTPVREGQTLMDIAIQQPGDVQTLFDVAMLNDLSITDDLVIGEDLITPAAPVHLLNVVAAFATEHHKPASGLTVEDHLQINGGIDYMGIQIDLFVR